MTNKAYTLIKVAVSIKAVTSALTKSRKQGRDVRPYIKRLTGTLRSHLDIGPKKPYFELETNDFRLERAGRPGRPKHKKYVMYKDRPFSEFRGLNVIKNSYESAPKNLKTVVGKELARAAKTGLVNESKLNKLKPYEQ